MKYTRGWDYPVMSCGARSVEMGLSAQLFSGDSKAPEVLAQEMASLCYTRSPRSALLPYFGGGFPTKIDSRKKAP